MSRRKATKERRVHTPRPAPELLIPPPMTGIHVGVKPSGESAVLRLFRDGPTRVMAFAADNAVGRLIIAAPSAGASVRIISHRPATWAPALQRSHDALLVTETSAQLRENGPMLVIDDRAERPRPLPEPKAWQCVIDVRSYASGPIPASIDAMAPADLAIFGYISREFATPVSRVFGLEAHEAAKLLQPIMESQITVTARGVAEIIALRDAN